MGQGPKTAPLPGGQRKVVEEAKPDSKEIFDQSKQPGLGDLAKRAGRTAMKPAPLAARDISSNVRGARQMKLARPTKSRSLSSDRY